MEKLQLKLAPFPYDSATNCNKEPNFIFILNYIKNYNNLLLNLFIKSLIISQLQFFFDILRLHAYKTCTHFGCRN